MVMAAVAAVVNLRLERHCDHVGYYCRLQEVYDGYCGERYDHYGDGDF